MDRIEGTVETNHCARLCLKIFEKVFCPRKERNLWTEEKCTPPLSIKGYALYKIDGDSTLQQQNSTWCPYATNGFSELPLLLFGNMLLIFSFCFFFLSMYTFLFCLYTCPVCETLLLFFLYIFHSVLLSFDWTCVFHKL